MPQSLCWAFAHSREYAVLENQYRNGESLQLRNFYDARKELQESFYFYDPYETVPKFSYDPTGTATQGRYAVRLEGAWEQAVELRRLRISLVEVA